MPAVKERRGMRQSRENRSGRQLMPTWEVTDNPVSRELGVGANGHLARRASYSFGVTAMSWPSRTQPRENVPEI